MSDDKSDELKDDGASSSTTTTTPKNPKDKKVVDELSLEDKALKESLELLVLRVRDPISGVARLGIFFSPFFNLLLLFLN